MSEATVEVVADVNYPTLLHGSDKQNAWCPLPEKRSPVARRDTLEIPPQAEESTAETICSAGGDIDEINEGCLENGDHKCERVTDIMTKKKLTREAEVEEVELDDVEEECEGEAGEEDQPGHEEPMDATEAMPARPERIIDVDSEETFWKAAQKALRERARRVKVDAFLKLHGFKSVNERKGWLFSYTYPLHLAVELNDVDMARTLIKSKARKKQRDASGRTPKQIALDQNRFGSHDEILRVLHRPKRQVPATQPLADDAAIDATVLNASSTNVAECEVVRATIYGKAGCAAVDRPDVEPLPDGI